MSQIINQRGAQRLLATIAIVLAAMLCAGFAPSAAHAATPVYTGRAFGPEGISGSDQPEGSFVNPQSVAVEQKSGDVYVYDAGHGGGSIYKFNDEGEPEDFSAMGGNVIENVGEPFYGGSDESELAVDGTGGPTAGDVYFVNGGSTVTVFGPEGDQIAELNSGVEAEGGEWGETCGVAVDPSGDVYAAFYGVGIDKFTPTASPVEDSNYVSALWEVTPPACQIAADSEESLYANVYPVGSVTKYAASQFNASKTAASGTEVDTESENATLATDPATNELYFDKVDAIEQYSSTGSHVATFGASGAGALNESYGVAFDDPSGEVYADNGGHVEIFGAAPPPPTATIEPATTVGQSTATLNGEVDPEGSQTTYHFEYSSNRTHWTALPESSAGEGSSEVPVSETVTGLAGNTTYYARLVVESPSGSETSVEATFTTEPAPPRIAAVAATGLAASEATLDAEIYPENEPTTYIFEYGTTTNYGSNVPAGQGSIAATSEPVVEAQTLSGLTPDTTYYYRVTASNGVAAPTVSAGHTFTTYPSLVAPATCPNQQERAESNLDPAAEPEQPFSLALPECRAYEMVTPSQKDAAKVITGTTFLGGTDILSVSMTGSSLSVTSPSSWEVPGYDAIGTTAKYELQQTAAGWLTSSLNPPASQFRYSTVELQSPDDAGVGVYGAVQPSQPESAGDLYLREPQAAGGACPPAGIALEASDACFVLVGPIAPAAATAGSPGGGEQADNGGALQAVSVQGASANLSRILFTIQYENEDYFWPGDGTTTALASQELPSLYEYLGTGNSGEGSEVPALVGLDNNGTQISECGTALGSYLSPTSLGTVRNAVSAAGSTVFFNAQAGGCATGATGPVVDQLYAKIGTPGGTTVTVNVAGRSGCEAASCNVTAAPVYQGAASDGSKVFFTDDQADLAAGDSDASNVLYECELPGDKSATPTPSGTVNPCPSLHAISVATGGAAEVQKVLAIAEDGSRVYYTARGVLTSSPNAQGQTAHEGEENLYAYGPNPAAPGQYTTTFIATLPSSPAEAQVTPSGEFLLFTSSGDLTLDDSSSVAQAFRYQYATGELIRVSAGQDGFDENGNTDTYPAALAPTLPEGQGRTPRSSISEDGEDVVFQTTNALTPGVHGGVNNVYLWHDGEVFLISDGTDTSTEAGLIGIDATGANIFFTTRERLVGQDTDESIDIYDARIDGGFAAPTKPPSCTGEACQGALSSPLGPLTPGSTSPAKVGNLPSKKSVAKTAKVEITKHKVKGTTITLTVKAPAKGKLTTSGTGLKKTSKSVKRAGTYKLNVKLTKAEQKKLKRKKKLTAKVEIVFKPASGKASSASVKVRLKS